MDLFEALYRENKKLSRINEDVKINPDWKDELRHRLIMINDDGYLCDSSIVDCCKDLHYDYPDVDFDEAYDYAYSLVDSDDLYEDTVRQANGKWVNKGKEGTHGEFKTKKAADAQRKAMFANKGESLKESMSRADMIDYIENKWNDRDHWELLDKIMTDVYGSDSFNDDDPKEGMYHEFSNSQLDQIIRRMKELTEFNPDIDDEFYEEALSHKIFTVHEYQAYPYIGAIELNDQLDKNGEGKKLKFTSRKDLEDKVNELLSQGYTSNNYDTYQDKITESKVLDLLDDSESDNEELPKVPNVSPIVAKVLERFDYATLDLNHPDTITMDVSDIIKNKAETVVNALGREGVKAEVIYTGTDGTDICIKILHTPDEDQQIIFK